LKEKKVVAHLTNWK